MEYTRSSPFGDTANSLLGNLLSGNSVSMYTLTELGGSARMAIPTDHAATSADASTSGTAIFQAAARGCDPAASSCNASPTARAAGAAIPAAMSSCSCRRSLTISLASW